MGDEPNSFYARLGRLSAIVLILPSSMAAGWVAGYFLIDSPLGIFPWGSVALTLGAAIAGFYEIGRILLRERDETKDR